MIPRLLIWLMRCKAALLPVMCSRASNGGLAWPAKKEALWRRSMGVRTHIPAGESALYLRLRWIWYC